MTPAPILAEPPKHRPTGNLSLHLESSPTAPQIFRVGGVSLLMDGLLDLVGTLGMRPLLEVEGNHWQGSVLEHWIPTWENEHLKVTLLAPWNERGFAVRIESKNSGPVRVCGSFDYLGLRRFREERLEPVFRTGYDAWTRSYVLEARIHRTLLALGLQADVEPSRAEWGVSYTLEWDSGQVTLYVAVAPEADGARTGALHLRRVGWDALWRKTLEKLEALSSGYQGALPDVYKRHLYFAYFYAQADSLEGEPVLMTSRSPHYYVSGAYWARDALLWFFPALLQADRGRARSVLWAAFKRYARWPGEHAQYLSGPPLYPGFELDEAAAYPLALARYLEGGEDPELVRELREPLGWVWARVAQEKHPELPLYKTFLSPTDDPVPYPYLGYSNALWAMGLERLAPFWDEDLKTEATAVRSALYAHGVREGKFAFAFEPGGGHLFADEPAGSLLLLPHLGFCTPDDPVWQATARWILGSDNPYHFGGKFTGEGSAHFPYPSGFGLANRLLVGEKQREGALEVYANAPLDLGYAPESFDPETGEARTGAGFAALAGFTAYALRSGDS